MKPAKGASLVGLRELNARAVLGVIRARAPISRAQVSREVGLTKPTVAAALETLLCAGLVRETSPDDGRLSFGATFFGPAPEAAHSVALDVDRRQCRAALADAAGRVIAAGDSVGANATPTALVGRAVELTRDLEKQAGVDPGKLAAAVAGVPAAVGPRDGVLRLSAYQLLEGFPLASVLSEALRVPAVAHNDTNLAALGERAEGAARGASDFAYLTVGRTVGAGIVLDGEVVRGAYGASGEIDTPAAGPGFLSGSPAADAFHALAKETLAASPGGRASFAATPRAVFAAAARGDLTAARIVSEEAQRIAERAAMVCRVVDVELVVLGGGIGRRCQPLLEEIRASMARRVAFPPRVEISALTEPPVLVGARAVGVDLLWETVMTERLAAP